MTASLIVIILILIAAILAIVYFGKKIIDGLKSQLAETVRDLETSAEEVSLQRQRERMEEETAHSTKISGIKRKHLRDLEALKREGREAAATLKKEKDEAWGQYDQLLKACGRMVDYSDRESRKNIIRECEQAGLDAILFSNIMFNPAQDGGSEDFHSQIDHLLVTQWEACVIENKYWNSVIYDNYRPKNIDSVFKWMTRATDFPRNGEWVLRIKTFTESNRLGKFQSELHCDPAPAKQARKQAGRLSRFLSKIGVKPLPFISTAVYYSHPESIVFHPSEVNGTKILGSAAELRSFIQARTAAGRGTQLPVDRIAQVFEPLGADITGIGAYRERWPSLLDLPRRSPSAASAPPRR